MRLIPKLAQLGHIESRAEARVASLIEQVQGHQPACCLYSLHLPEHEYKRMSEIDFLIVFDDVVLVVEVKGGRISRREGLWIFTDRYGHSNSKREGPFEQARSAMFALSDRLTKQLPSIDVAFGYLVITPDQELEADVEWDPQLHAGPRAMSVAGLERALSASRKYWLEKQRSKPAGHAYGDLIRVLRPDFDRVPSLAARVTNLEEDFVRFADRQYELLLAAERNPRIVCTGGAGSGKTLLAIETARRAAADGKSVLVTCRSTTLASLIGAALEQSGARCVPFSEIGDADPVDVLVVDEAQDLMDLHAYAQLDSLVAGGWDSGCWRIFCDVNNQANVDGHFDSSVFDDLLIGVTLVDLPFNCRNTATIVHQTQLTTGADIGVARAGEGPAVEFRECTDDESAARLLDAHLKQLRQQEVPLADVTIISLRDRVEDSAATLTSAYRSRSIEHSTSLIREARSQRAKANLVTVAEIKGLEAPHVCVIDVDDTVDALARARLYVAMTRARISLWIGLGPVAWTPLAATSQVGAHE